MTYKRGENPNSLANLEKGRFKKGEVANPRGRPSKELCITNILREQLEEECPYAPGKTWAQWLARRALELAGENATYYKELLDRVEGKVIQPIGGEGGKDLTFNIVVSGEQTKDMVSRVLAGERTD